MTSRLLNMLWVGGGISITALYFGAQLVGAPVGPAPAAAILGLLFFVSSFLCGHAWLRWVAVLWWLALPLLFHYRGDPTLLLLSAGLWLGLLALPGIVLLRRPRPAPVMA